uniref:Small ribosomal subunit protein uS14 n=1 Tax=Calidris pygmaea TaxID=425635 RepID=A0A8C3PMD2_9CHAR
MGHQQLYWSHPRKFGQGSRSCRVCSNRHGLIRKYGLNMCRQCFRQYAKDIGFIKVRLREPGLFSLEARRLRGRPHCPLQLTERRVSGGGCWLLLPRE